MWTSPSLRPMSHVPDYAEDWFTPPSVRILTPWEPEASNSSLLPRKIAPLLGFQPNIIFILTDDQDRLLGTTSDYDTLGPLAVMPQLRKGLMDEGAVIDNFFVNTPICCPSRTEFLTGRYFHNVGPPSRSGACMHADTSLTWGRQTGLFGLLTAAGYNTGAFGKVTNDQAPCLNGLVQSESVNYIDAPLDYNDYNGRTYFRLFANGTTHTERLDRHTRPNTPYWNALTLTLTLALSH